MVTSMKNKYSRTVRACYMGYVVQAAVNNFVPLLFVFFNSSFGIPLSKITLLVTVNFIVQLLIDIMAAGFVDKIGYKKSVMLADVMAAAGLVCLGTLPYIIDPYTGLFISVLIYAVGGGLLEVVISPMVEACPTEHKSGAMSLLHSFYCWGHMAVVLLSTLFFVVFGMENWRFAAFIWAAVPAANLIYFSGAPIPDIVSEGHKAGLLELFKRKLFWLMFLLMLCAGASELSMSQWASAFAEKGLNITKTAGDILGTCMFAALMGTSRLLYSAVSKKTSLKNMMLVSSALCVLSYIIAGCVKNPIAALAGCGLCGFSVGIMWPGTLSLSAKRIPSGGTAMFAMLALGGDVGASIGPTMVGFVSEAAGDNLKLGLLAAIIFPVMLMAGVAALKQKTKKA